VRTNIRADHVRGAEELTTNTVRFSWFNVTHSGT
jgi:hypothetical protein